MFDTVDVTCPYCFEQLEVDIDPETQGELVRDCDVCCRPWTLRVSRTRTGALEVQVLRAQ